MSIDKPDAPANFVILTLPRSGSYHLVSLLDSAKDVVCHGELFKQDAVELSADRLAKLGLTSSDVQVRDARPMAFLQRVRGLNGKKIVGFKMFSEHAQRVRPLKEHVLRNPRWLKIILRRNPVESYASLLRARATGIWTVRRTAPGAHPRERLDAPVVFDPESFDRHLEMVRWFDETCRNVISAPDNRCLEIDYAGVTQGPDLKRVLDFIGSAASPDSLTSDYGRQFQAALADGFSNWADLVQHAGVRGLDIGAPPAGRPAQSDGPAG